MRATRRRTLAALATGVIGSLAGCADVGPWSDDGESGPNAEEEPIEVAVGGDEVFELVTHHFEESDAGPELFVTIRNKRDVQLPEVLVDCTVYDGDEVVAESWLHTSFDPGEQDQQDMTFTDADADAMRASTHYEIVIEADRGAGAAETLTEEFDDPVLFQED